MKEILAENLKPLFDNTILDGKCTYKGKEYEVWEVSDKSFKIMDSMTEEEFKALCPNGWWRSSDGTYNEVPMIKYIINGEKILAWDDKRLYFYDDCCNDCKDRING